MLGIEKKKEASVFQERMYNMLLILIHKFIDDD